MKLYIRLIITTFVLIFALSGCNSDYVVKVGKNKISRGEYLVYLMEQKNSFEEQGGSDIWEADFDGVSAEEIAKQNALNSIVVVKTAVAKTKELGIELSSEDVAKIDEKTDEMLKDFSADDLKNLELDNGKIKKIMTEVALQQKVYDFVTDNYTVNEEEFREYLTTYYNEHKADYSKYTINEIFIQPDDTGTTSKDTATQAYDSITKGGSFIDEMKKINPQSSLQPVELDPSLYTEKTLAEIYNHQKGDVFMVDDTDGYHIFQIADIVIQPMEEVEPEIRNSYINDKKQEIYQAQNDSWQGNINIEKNDDVWQNISIVRE